MYLYVHVSHHRHHQNTIANLQKCCSKLFTNLQKKAVVTKRLQTSRNAIIHICAYTYIYIVHICKHMYIYVHIHMYIYVYVFVHISAYICIYMYINVLICTCIVSSSPSPHDCKFTEMLFKTFHKTAKKCCRHKKIANFTKCGTKTL